MTVGTPGTPTLVSYVDYDDTPSLTWTASSVSGGDVIQWYELNYVNSKTGTPVWTRGRYTEVEVPTNSHTMAVADGIYAHWRVRTAYKVGGAGSVVYTSYSGTLTKYILFRGDNDWTNFTNIASNITTTFEFEDLPTATSKDAGLHKKVTQNTTTSTTYTAASNYIYRDFTGLTVGRTYYCTATAILGTAGIQGNIYRFQVNTTVPTVGSAATLTTTESTVPTLTFVATATTHRIRFELNETFTQTSTGTKEDFALRDFALYEILDAPYQLQSHLETLSVAQEFDLASQSVGGYWWVDRDNVTRFSQFPITEVPSYTFTDEAGVEGDLHYTDIEAGYDSRDIVNSVTVNNFGRRPQNPGSSNYDADSVEYTQTQDVTSVNNWGTRSISLNTNIYMPTVDNLLTNPSLEESVEGVTNGNATNCVMRKRRITKFPTPVTSTTSNTISIGTKTFNVTNTAPFAVGKRIRMWNTAAPKNFVEGYITAMVANTSVTLYVDEINGSGTFTAWTLSQVSPVANGNNALMVRLTSATTGAIDPYWNSTENYEILAEPGQTFSATGYIIRTNGTPNATASITIRFYDDVGNFISGSGGASVTLTNNGIWQQMTATGVAPDGTVTALIRVPIVTTGTHSNGQVFLLDGFLLNVGSNGTYFDGNSANSDSYIYRWFSAENLSASRRYENNLDGRITKIVTDFASPEFTVKSLTWNAAEDFDTAYLLDVGQNVTVDFKGTTGLYRITGIEHQMTPDSWIVRLKLGKV